MAPLELRSGLEQPGLTPRAPHRFWHKCSAARRWSATCPAYRGRCGARCAPGAQPAGQSMSMRQPKPSPSVWPRASYWGYGWTRRSARSCPELSSSLWGISSRCPWTCLSAACARYYHPSPRPSSCSSLGAPHASPMLKRRVVAVGAGLPSALTCCMSRGGPHTLSGPDGPGPAPAAAAAGLLLDTLWQEPQESAQPLPRMAPPGWASNTPLEARTAAERMGALGLQTRPRPSPAPARVGGGWVPAPGPRPRAR